MKKLIATTTLAATALAGGIVLGPTLAGAQDADDTTAAVEETWVDTALEPLIADGTLTQAQADAVETALRDARPERPFRDGRRHGGPGVLADLGLDAETVRAGIEAGQTIGEIAEANGISADDVVAALVDKSQERIDAALAAGRITADEAAEAEANAQARAESIVDGTAELPRRHGPHGGGGADNADAVDEGEVTGS